MSKVTSKLQVTIPRRIAERLRLFDEANERQRQRQARMKLPASPPTDRGWTREELYTRGKPG